MMKCEDVLMSSDLFTNDILFNEFPNDQLDSNVNNPFDFLNTSENIPEFASTSTKDPNRTVTEFLENPQSLYFPANSTNESNVQSTNQVVTDYQPVATAVKETVQNSNPPPILPKATFSPKENEVKLSTQQIRNIQPKPDTSAYRIVPVKQIGTPNSPSQTIQICSTAAVPTVESVTSAAAESSVKTVVPLTDLKILNNANAKKTVISSRFVDCSVAKLECSLWHRQLG